MRHIENIDRICACSCLFTISHNQRLMVWTTYAPPRLQGPASRIPKQVLEWIVKILTSSERTAAWRGFQPASRAYGYTLGMFPTRPWAAPRKFEQGPPRPCGSQYTPRAGPDAAKEPLGTPVIAQRPRRSPIHTNRPRGALACPEPPRAAPAGRTSPRPPPHHPPVEAPEAPTAAGSQAFERFLFNWPSHRNMAETFGRWPGVAQDIFRTFPDIF